MRGVLCTANRIGRVISGSYPGRKGPIRHVDPPSVPGRPTPPGLHLPSHLLTVVQVGDDGGACSCCGASVAKLCEKISNLCEERAHSWKSETRARHRVGAASSRRRRRRRRRDEDRGGDLARRSKRHDAPSNSPMGRTVPSLDESSHAQAGQER